MNLNQRFVATDDNLKLDPEERKRAEETHNLMGDVLVDAGVAKRTRLQGSFARKTMLPPLHDVDKVIELNDGLREELDASPIGPHRAMDMICNAVRPEFPGATFEIKKHSLGIALPEEGLDFDAVPAFNDEDGTDWIRIADTHTMGWKPSNTYSLIKTISERNLLCAGRFVHQVRMVKRVVFVAGLGEYLPGLHTETFCYAAITEVLSHPDAIAAALNTSASMLGTVYSDPTGADPISERLASYQWMKAQATLTLLADRATQAVELATAGDERAAALIWAELLGDVFPSPADEERDALRRTHIAPALVASGPATTPTRAWRPSV
jgi:hypothetical protein